MRFRRSLLLVMALIVGGGLGAVLLPKFEPVKIILFFAICSGILPNRPENIQKVISVRRNEGGRFVIREINRIQETE